MDIIDIEKLRAKAVEMMVEVKNILERHRVEFWVEYGTMLGAVRTGQMIPWDSEIDIGVFESSFINREKVLDDLKRNGFEIKFTPDRIKIYKAGWWLGSFNFDLHLYHIDKDEAYVSAGMSDSSLMNTMFDRLEWLISIYDRRRQVVYRFDRIMKLLATRFDIRDQNSLPKRIMFTKGPYNSPLSFQLLGEDFCLERSPIDEDTTRFTLLAVKLLSHLPSSLIAILNAIVAGIRPETKYKTVRQRVPLHLYTNLSEITLCGIPFKAPKEREKYLELIYGPTWKTPNVKWRQKDMRNLK